MIQHREVEALLSVEALGKAFLIRRYWMRNLSKGGEQIQISRKEYSRQKKQRIKFKGSEVKECLAYSENKEIKEAGAK